MGKRIFSQEKPVFDGFFIVDIILSLRYHDGLSFLKAGGVFSTPSCGPCLGGHLGILAKGERAIATTNRNFRGRMGHPDSEVYLSNPAVAAASAVKGRIAHPEEI